jgi:hypothetical protein
MNPQRSGITFQMRGPRERVDVVALPVDMFTVTLPVTPAFRVSDAGTKVQRAFEGSVPHAKVNDPEEPLSGVSTTV